MIPDLLTVNNLDYGQIKWASYICIIWINIFIINIIVFMRIPQLSVKFEFISHRIEIFPLKNQQLNFFIIMYHVSL